MKATLKAGLALGILVFVWMLIFGYSGWYKDPTLTTLWYFVILIQIGVLVWGLRETAKEGRTYGGQVAAGTLISLIGGIIIIITSIAFVTYLFPTYFEDVRSMGVQLMRAEGKSEADIEQYVNTLTTMQNPLMQGIMGFLGTMITGVVASLIIAAFTRKQPSTPPA